MKQMACAREYVGARAHRRRRNSLAPQARGPVRGQRRSGAPAARNQETHGRRRRGCVRTRLGGAKGGE